MAITRDVMEVQNVVDFNERLCQRMEEKRRRAQDQVNEKFTGKILSRIDSNVYEVEVDGKKIVMKTPYTHNLRINPGTSVIFYGRKRFYGKQEVKEWVDVDYLEILDSDGKILAEYAVEIPLF